MMGSGRITPSFEISGDLAAVVLYRALFKSVK
jgi:hypothetical protein